MLKIIQTTHSEDPITYSVLDRDLNSTDFLTDPELYKDPLPQPFRRIDKILNELIDEIWIKIEKNDTEKTIEAQKYRPEKIERVSILEVIK
jgi:hypothetical protein